MSESAEPPQSVPPQAEEPQRREARIREVPPALAHAVFGYGPPWVRDFADMQWEWRRLVAEFVGTFMLVLVGAGAGVVDAYTHGAISRGAAVVAPGLMVGALILGIGAVSGAHLNPVVSVAFALRQEFPWRRVPLYIGVQLVGAVFACGILRVLFGDVGQLGATVPGSNVGAVLAAVTEGLLTFGLLTTILGTASGAQNVGPLSAIAVAGYIALAGLWSSPISGASMNPARSLGPEIVLGQFSDTWIYLVGPTAGMLVAVGLAIVLRGRGADPTAARAAQGGLGTLVLERALEQRESSTQPPTPQPTRPPTDPSQ